MAQPVAELSRLVGLADDTLTVALAREPLLSTVPEPLDRAGDDEYDAAAVDLRFRKHSSRPASAPLPTRGDPEAPLVYVTFGSVTGSLAPFARVFREALDGLAELPVRVFMTVGRRLLISDLGPLPPNAWVEPWWPQEAVLPYAALVLGHGGFGTTMGAICAGLPQVVVPIFTSDQIINSRHVTAIGAGRSVCPAPDAVTLACQEVSTVLADPTYRAAAAGVAAANDLLPTVAEAVRVIPRLTR